MHQSRSGHLVNLEGNRAHGGGTSLCPEPSPFDATATQITCCFWPLTVPLASVTSAQQPGPTLTQLHRHPQRQSRYAAVAILILAPTSLRPCASSSPSAMSPELRRVEWPEPAVRRPLMIASQSSSSCQAAQGRASKGEQTRGGIHVNCQPAVPSHQAAAAVVHRVAAGSGDAELAAKGVALPLDGMLSHLVWLKQMAWHQLVQDRAAAPGCG